VRTGSLYIKPKPKLILGSFYIYCLVSPQEGKLYLSLTEKVGRHHESGERVGKGKARGRGGNGKRGRNRILGILYFWKLEMANIMYQE